MLRNSFNDNWSFGVKLNEFAEATGAAASKVTVTLPHDAMLATTRDENASSGAPNAYFPGGVWEYIKEFDVPAAWAEKVVLLNFEGVYRSATVSLNGARIAIEPNGYTDFVVSLDAHLKFGERNRLTVEARAHNDSRWYTGAGIYRPVHLLVAEPVHIALDGVTIRTRDVDAGEAMVEVDTLLRNATRHAVTARLHTAIRDSRGTTVLVDETPVTILPGEDALAVQRMHLANPNLWSPEHPTLYEVHTTLLLDEAVVDRSVERFGVRRLQVDVHHGLRVNGSSVVLRGACVHHDNGILGAVSIGRAEERRVELLREAGFNALRSAHQPMSRSMLDACDRLGMLVIDEAFDMWTRPKNDFDYALDFENGWRADIDAMIRKDRNHPAVIAYSIGNEIPELATPDGAAWSRRIATHVRSVDDTRFVTAGVNGALTVMAEVIASMAEQATPEDAPTEPMGINTFLTQMAESNNAIGASDLVTERTAEGFATLDIAGMNYLDGRYEQDAKQFPNRVIVGSETFPTRIDVLWDLVKRLPHVIGDFTWTGWDYLGEVGIGRTILAREEISGLLAPYPWLTAWTGDLDITGFRRPVSYYREIVFGLRSAPYIAVENPQTHGEELISGPWAWTDSTDSWTWPEHEGQPVRVEVYSDAEEVELVVGDKVVGRKPTGPAHRFRTEFDVTYSAGSVTAIAYRDGEPAERTTITTTGIARQVRLAADHDEIRNTHDALAYVTVTVVDDEGAPTSHDVHVTLSIDGSADLAGFGSAEPSQQETFASNQHTTFRGRALAALRPRSDGQVKITATAPGLEPSSVTIDVRELDAEASSTTQ